MASQNGNFKIQENTEGKTFIININYVVVDATSYLLTKESNWQIVDVQ